jgi:hypothetical protein
MAARAAVVAAVAVVMWGGSIRRKEGAVSCSPHGWTGEKEI